MKTKIDLEYLCSDLPREFKLFMRYCKNLPFKEKPAYSKLKSAFASIMTRMKFKMDFNYEWNL